MDAVSFLFQFIALVSWGDSETAVGSMTDICMTYRFSADYGPKCVEVL